MEKETKKTLEDFKKEFDKSTIIPQKIQAELDSLGKDGWEYEVDILKNTKISQTDFANYREQFSDYFFMLPKKKKRIWCGSIELKNKMESFI